MTCTVWNSAILIQKECSGRGKICYLIQVTLVLQEKKMNQPVPIRFYLAELNLWNYGEMITFWALTFKFLLWSASRRFSAVAYRFVPPLSCLVPVVASYRWRDKNVDQLLGWPHKLCVLANRFGVLSFDEIAWRVYQRVFQVKLDKFTVKNYLINHYKQMHRTPDSIRLLLTKTAVNDERMKLSHMF
jgi:hypothetical protein